MGWELLLAPGFTYLLASLRHKQAHMLGSHFCSQLLSVGFTAFSYAELATRYPVSAGESAYIDAGFGRANLATAVGILVAISGLVSASTITVGASGYLSSLTGAQPSALILGIVTTMGLLAWWGITQSVVVAGIVTVIEILGLIVVIGWSMAMTERLGVSPKDLIPPFWGGHWSGVISATVLAFFAFIGFEDMVNVAEEVEEPRRTIPKAIIYTLVIATILYLITCIAVTMAVPMEALAGSSAPLALVFADAPQAMQISFTAIAVMATVNGVLIQNDHGVPRHIWDWLIVVDCPPVLLDYRPTLKHHPSPPHLSQSVSSGSVCFYQLHALLSGHRKSFYACSYVSTWL